MRLPQTTLTDHSEGHKETKSPEVFLQGQKRVHFPKFQGSQRNFWDDITYGFQLHIPPPHTPPLTISQEIQMQIKDLDVTGLYSVVNGVCMWLAEQSSSWAGN